MATIDGEIVEQSYLGLAQTFGLGVSRAEQMSLVAYARNALGVQVSDSLSLALAHVLDYRPDATIAEALAWVDAPAAQAVFAPGLVHTVRLADLAQAFGHLTVAEGVSLAGLTSYAMHAAVLEALGLIDPLAANLHTTLTLVQALRLNEALGRFLGGDVTDGLALSATVGLAGRLYAAPAETVTLADALTGSLLLRVDLRDGLDVTATSLLAMLFDGRMVEGVAISGGLLEPSGSFTAWAVNTRTGAVTEYRDWAFTTFATLGRRHIAGNREGLWVLEGATDQGASIAARVRGGALQVNGSRYTGLKAVYLGARTADAANEYILKLIAGDGREYVYALRARDMRTTKINVGKGLRSRYFQWELASPAADFDIDTIEFVPLLSTRRV